MGHQLLWAVFALSCEFISISKYKPTEENYKARQRTATRGLPLTPNSERSRKALENTDADRLCDVVARTAALTCQPLSVQAEAALSCQGTWSRLPSGSDGGGREENRQIRVALGVSAQREPRAPGSTETSPLATQSTSGRGFCLRPRPRLTCGHGGLQRPWQRPSSWHGAAPERLTRQNA